jgi:uncharacterized protein (TIGR02466 family)
MTAGSGSTGFPEIVEGINLVFPTPIALVRWPRHAEVEEYLRALSESDPVMPVPWNRLKLESRNRLPGRADGALRELFNLTASMAGAMAESLLGMPLRQALLRDSAAAAGAFRHTSDNASDLTNARLVVEDAWVNGYDTGHFHAPHSHPGALFAATFVVQDSGGAAPEGAIAFMDPRREALNACAKVLVSHEGRDVLHMGRAGDLLIFPGWLTHYVLPHLQPRRRVSVSMNLVVQAFEVQDGKR